MKVSSKSEEPKEISPHSKSFRKSGTREFRPIRSWSSGWTVRVRGLDSKPSSKS